MTTAILFVYFSLFHAFILNLVDSKCPQSFPCGNIGNLQFPLTNQSQPECGLFAVECHARPAPKLHLDTEFFSPSYEIKKLFSSNKVRIDNPILELLLKSNSCNFFFNFSIPHSPYASFSFHPNITLFKCAKNGSYGKDYTNYYKGCDDFDIYYYNHAYVYSEGYDSYDLPTPDHCDKVFLPIKSQAKPYNTDLFDLLSPEYNLEWNLTDDCFIYCHNKGGQCTATINGGFRCDKGKSRQREIYISGFMAGTVVIFFIVVLAFRKFMLYRKGKAKIHTDNTELFLDFALKVPKDLSFMSAPEMDLLRSSYTRIDPYHNIS